MATTTALRQIIQDKRSAYLGNLSLAITLNAHVLFAKVPTARLLQAHIALAQELLQRILCSDVLLDAVVRALETKLRDVDDADLESTQVARYISSAIMDLACAAAVSEMQRIGPNDSAWVQRCAQTILETPIENLSAT